MRTWKKSRVVHRLPEQAARRGEHPERPQITSIASSQSRGSLGSPASRDLPPAQLPHRERYFPVQRPCQVRRALPKPLPWPTCRSLRALRAGIPSRVRQARAPHLRLRISLPREPKTRSVLPGGSRTKAVLEGYGGAINIKALLRRDPKTRRRKETPPRGESGPSSPMMSSERKGLQKRGSCGRNQRSSPVPRLGSRLLAPTRLQKARSPPEKCPRGSKKWELGVSILGFAALFRRRAPRLGGAHLGFRRRP